MTEAKKKLRNAHTRIARERVPTIECQPRNAHKLHDPLWAYASLLLGFYANDSLPAKYDRSD